MGSKKFNYWPYLLAAGIILILGTFAPYWFTQWAWGVEFGEETGPIGDTIGGITAPFLSLVGSILVFAALRAQIQANELVLEEFKREDEEMLAESLNKIEMLSTDLGSIIKDIELRGERMKEYYEKEHDFPFETNVLKRTSSRVYSRIIEFERLSIYKGFKQFKIEKEVWINKYNKLYSIFDYLPDFFDSIYTLNDRHIKDIFDQKMAVRKKLMELMVLSTKYTEEYKLKYPMVTAASSPEWAAVNKLILDYQALIDESFGPNGEMLGETDFNKMSNHVLLNFIKKALDIREANPNYNKKLLSLIEISAEVRRDIALIRQRATEFSKNVQGEYEKLIIDEEDKKSTLTIIKELKVFIDLELLKIQN
jgi:hypothetical protein